MITLLSTDFDGTLVEHDAIPQVPAELFALLRDLRQRGVLWAINTGRELDHIVEGLREFKFPIEPDFVLTAERKVFHRGASGVWQDYGDWNSRCLRDHQELFGKAGALLGDIQAYLRRHPQAYGIYEGDRMVGLATETEEQMDEMCAFLERERVRVPGFQFMRNTIYVRFCHEAYSKGTALGELARLTGVRPEQIFAAGDHYNDIPMLDGRHAKWVGCPSNAVPAVKKTVRQAGGYVACGNCGHGALEALRHFESALGRELAA